MRYFTPLSASPSTKKRHKKRRKSPEAYDKAKLRSSGLWDDSAARKGRLTITRIDRTPRIGN